jgi:hypothetical protein
VKILPNHHGFIPKASHNKPIARIRWNRWNTLEIIAIFGFTQVEHGCNTSGTTLIPPYLEYLDSWSHGRRPASMGRYRLGLAPTISRCRKSGWKRHEAVLRAWSCDVGPTVRIRLPPAASHVRTQSRFNVNHRPIGITPPARCRRFGVPEPNLTSWTRESIICQGDGVRAKQAGWG